MKERVLITGGSGMIGKQITSCLLNQGYEVVWLTRNPENKPDQPVKQYKWDIDDLYVDPKAFAGVDHIIHLAGASVAEKRWTEARKKEILTSRVRSTEIIYQALRDTHHQIKTFISASAIGYYGFSNADTLFTETSRPANDFLADVTFRWEKAASMMEQLHIRTVIMRIGIVLSNEGGAYVDMKKPIQYYLGASLGTGKQMVSWIHVDDLVHMFLFALQNPQTKGIYNCVAPNPVSNLQLMKTIAKQINKPLFPIGVPGIVLQILLGEMAELVVNGSNVSSKKIEEKGFEFQYPTIDQAVAHLA